MDRLEREREHGGKGWVKKVLQSYMQPLCSSAVVRVLVVESDLISGEIN